MTALPVWLPDGVDWSQWTVILLKPDCVQRGLVDELLREVGREVQVVSRRTIQPTEEQIFAHYDDMIPLSTRIGRDVPAELRRIFVGNDTGLALGHGDRAAPRVRALHGPTDPAIAPERTLRGRYGIDSLRQAQRDGRLVDNLIHTSDTVEAVARDFGIWFSPDDLPLLTAPTRREGGTP